MADLTPPETSGDDREQLRAERDYWKALFDSLVAELPEPAAVLSADGEITHWNREAEELTGVAAETATGSHAQEFADVDDGEELVAAAAIRAGQPVREAEPRSGVDAAGNPWHTHDFAGLLYDHEGNIAGSFMAAAEITETVEQLNTANEYESLVDDVTRSVKRPISELQSTASEIAANTSEISAAADEQFEQVDEIAGEVSNLSATVEEVASTAEEVERTSERAEELALDGRAAADEAEDVIDDIGSAVDDVTTEVDSLQGRVEEIDGIVNAINDIAEQTNILALTPPSRPPALARPVLASRSSQTR